MGALPKNIRAARRGGRPFASPTPTYVTSNLGSARWELFPSIPGFFVAKNLIFVTENLNVSGENMHVCRRF